MLVDFVLGLQREAEDIRPRGLPLPYRNPYQVRHTYASTLLTASQNPWYVAQQLRHEDVEMVFSTYGKFIREDYQKPKAELRIVG